MKPWVVYTLIRVTIFAASFALLYGVFAIAPWLSALIAAALGLTISYIFFRPQRDAAITSLGAKPKSAVSDEDAEG